MASVTGYCGNTTADCTHNYTCGGGIRRDGKCADGTCCSKKGYCGTTLEYCNDPRNRETYRGCFIQTNATGPALRLMMDGIFNVDTCGAACYW